MATKIIIGNCLEVLPTLEANSIHCSISSPPYFGLRAYSGSQQCEWPEIEYSPMSGLPPIQIPGCDPNCEHEWGPNLPPSHPGQVEQTKWKDAKAAGHGQTAPSGNYCQKCGGWRGALGNEPTIEMYIGHLVAIYREAYRVLREDGVAFVVMGDSYCSQGGFRDYGSHDRQTGRKFNSGLRLSGKGLKQGDLMMVPHRLALALQADGWIVRNDLVWHKKAPMPESVAGHRWERHRIKVKKSERATSPYHEAYGNHPQGAGVAARKQREAYYEKGEGAPQWIDCPGCPKCEANDGYILKRGSWRHTRSHEFVIHMVKKMQYFSDQEKVREPLALPNAANGTRVFGGTVKHGANTKHGHRTEGRVYDSAPSGRNPRSVLTPKPEPFPGSHFAVYPTSLIEPLIKAACPDKCCPKCGKGWAPVVKKQKAAVTNPRPFSKPGNEGDRNDVGRIYEETTSNVLGYRPTCECGADPGMKEVEIPFEPGGDSGFFAPKPIPGTVLDPFSGSGTTGLVCERLGLNSILIEIGSEYAEMSRKRIFDDAPLLNKVEIVARELDKETQNDLP